MDDLFVVLADPTRRRLLELISERARTVSELVDAVDIHQPGVSRHLKILHDAGLVTVRRDAQRRIYALRAEPLRELDTWLAEYRSQWDVRFDKLADHLRRNQKKGEK